MHVTPSALHLLELKPDLLLSGALHIWIRGSDHCPVPATIGRYVCWQVAILFFWQNRVVEDDNWQVPAHQTLGHCRLVDVSIAACDGRSTFRNVCQVEDIGECRGEAVVGRIFALVAESRVDAGSTRANKGAYPNTYARSDACHSRTNLNTRIWLGAWGTFNYGHSARDQLPSYVQVLRKHTNAKQIHLRVGHVLLAEAEVELWVLVVCGAVHGIRLWKPFFITVR